MRQCELCKTNVDIHEGLVTGGSMRMCNRCFYAYSRGREDALREMTSPIPALSHENKPAQSPKQRTLALLESRMRR